MANGRRAAISFTKSHSPFSITLSMILATARSTLSSARWIIRGVNPRETIPRIRACRSPSRLIMFPKYSRKGSGRSPMLVPCPEQKISGLRLTWRMSACLVTAQYPRPRGISIPSGTGGSWWKDTGRSRRSVAKAPSRSSIGRSQSAMSLNSISSTDRTSRGCIHGSGYVGCSMRGRALGSGV